VTVEELGHRLGGRRVGLVGGRRQGAAVVAPGGVGQVGVVAPGVAVEVEGGLDPQFAGHGGEPVGPAAGHLPPLAPRRTVGDGVVGEVDHHRQPAVFGGGLEDPPDQLGELPVGEVGRRLHGFFRGFWGGGHRRFLGSGSGSVSGWTSGSLTESPHRFPPASPGIAVTRRVRVNFVGGRSSGCGGSF